MYTDQMLDMCVDSLLILKIHHPPIDKRFTSQDCVESNWWRGAQRTHITLPFSKEKQGAAVDRSGIAAAAAECSYYSTQMSVAYLLVVY